MVFIASMISRVWPSADRVADRHERRRARLRLQIDRADHRRVDRVARRAGRLPRRGAAQRPRGTRRRRRRRRR